MNEAYGEHRLIFRLDASEPIELDKLGESFSGVAREYEAYLSDLGVESKEKSEKLLVTNLNYGSYEFEVASAVGLYMSVRAAGGELVLWTDFFDRIKEIMNFLSRGAKRPENFDKGHAQNFDKFLETVAGKKGASLTVRKAKYEEKSKKREIIAEFEFDERDLANAHTRLLYELEQAEDEAKEYYRYVQLFDAPFIWHRTDRDKAKTSGNTSDRGVVSKVTNKPLPVYFASNMEKAKHDMNMQDKNPFELVYIVDVFVSYDPDGNPKFYTISDVKKTIHGGDA